MKKRGTFCCCLEEIRFLVFQTSDVERCLKEKARVDRTGHGLLSLEGKGGKE